MMTPEEAKAALAAAHEGMTEAEIAEHATCLAMVVAGNDDAASAQFEGFATVTRTNDSLRKMARNIAICLRQVKNLNSAHRKGEARRLLDEMIEATTPFLNDDTVGIEPFRPIAAEEAWPDIFTPKGTRHGG